MSENTPTPGQFGSPEFNHVMYMGRLTKNPQFYPVNDDGPEHDHDRCWAVIAYNPPTKSEKAVPVFMPINCFGRNARILAEFGKKGKGWGVEGALKTRSEVDADGKHTNYCEIMVRRHIMGNDAKNTAPVEEPQEQPASEAKSDDAMAAYAAKLVDAGVDPDDVPALVAKKKQESGDAPF